MTTLTRRPILSVLVLLVALATFGCSALAEASILPQLTGPLVTVTTRGGECFDGPCGGTVAIERDGRVHQTAPTEAETGQLPVDILAALETAVRTTDYATVRAVAFDAECPVYVDGQEFIYEFGAPGGVERVASCEFVVDPAHPLFAAVNAALVSVGLPPTG
jgi:hypothetical protein